MRGEAGAAYSGDGKPQAGMGGAPATSTATAGSTSSRPTFGRHLGLSTATPGQMTFDDVTFTSGIGRIRAWLARWGCGFVDFDNDAALDICSSTATSTPRSRGWRPRLVTRSARSSTATCGGGGFADITEQVGGPSPGADGEAAAAPSATSTTTATSTFVINPVTRLPGAAPRRHGRATWIQVRAVGVSRPERVGARLRASPRSAAHIDEVRAGELLLAERPARALRPGVGEAGQDSGNRCRAGMGTRSAA